MENLVVITFPELEKAMEGLTRLKELDTVDEITIYGIAFIHKKEDGAIEYLYHDGADSGRKVATGAAAGMLIGLLGGPLGMLLGMLTGAGLGQAMEDDTIDLDHHFISKVNKHLEPGTYALVTDAEEDVVILVDAPMELLGGMIVRTSVDDETERFENEQWDKFNQEIDAKEAEFKTEVGEKKEKLKHEIKELKDKQHQRMMKFREKATARKNHLHDKIEVLRKKMQAANQKNKEKFALKLESFKKRLAAFNERVAWAFS
ncbi:MAG: hypothetical protein JWR50_307 [Mucilaginibacter sp.]|nr:hypothetical protein [Mucilaginibacter sp.]